MKKKTLLTTTLLFALLGAGCRKENQEKSINPDFIKLQKMGFSTTNIVTKNDYYIVEGDIMIYKKDLATQDTKLNTVRKIELAANKNAIAQAYTGTVVQRTTITVYIDPSMPPSGGSIDWRTAVNQAISNWNAINNFSLNFVITTSLPADITIYPDYYPRTLNQYTYGSGAYPLGSAPGNNIVLNVSSLPQTLTPAALELVATHEFGHTIAFRHTNYYFEAGDIPVLINGTIPSTLSAPNADANSVMTSGTDQSSQTWRGFDNFDILAARTIYPLDATQKPIYRYRNSNGGRHFYTANWSELGLARSGYTYEWPSGYLFNYAKTGTVAFYRFNNPTTSDHFYTTSNAAIQGYVLEGAMGYVYTTQVTGTIPLYKYNKSGVHFYTIDYSELGAGAQGYTYEGIACYVLQ